MSLWVDDVTLIVEFGFGSGPFAASPTWTNIVTDTRAVDINRGRSSVQSTFSAGTATIVLDNSGGEYDPNNSTATHAGDLNIGTPVRIRATHSVTTYTLFYGHVSNWPLTFQQPNESRVFIEVIESAALLRTYHLEAQAYSLESTDTRIGNILDDVGWPAARRNLDTGLADCAAETYTGNAKSLVDAAVEAEQGLFFVARTGNATLFNRIQYSSASAVATFGPVNLHYMNPQFTYDDDTLINRSTVTPADGDTQSATDATSISTYGPAGEDLGTFTNDSLPNGAAALNVAEWLVGKHKDIAVRIREFTVTPQVDPSNLWPQVLSLDLGAVVNVKYSPPAGDDLDQDVRIEQVRHEIRPGAWTTVYGCYPLSTFETNDYWVLDTSDLETEARLA